MPYLHVPPLQLGPITIHAFGVLAMLAIVLGAKASRRRAVELGLEPGVIDQAIPWIVVGVFVVAHLVAVLLYHPERVARDPLVLLRFWDGISSFGGFFGGLFAAVLFFRLRKVKVKKYSEAMIFGAVVALAVGRVGCSVAHDHPGKVTDSPLAVKGWPTAETPKRGLGFYTEGPRRHDLGFYELLLLIPITVLMYALKCVRPFEGFHIVLALLLYTPVRFFLDFLRTADRHYLGLTPGQYFAALLFGVALVLMVQGVRKSGTGPPAAEAPA
ncbi:MAG: prolipoprotein diacylglyceryl transferase [Deltaproteobacteria bacterium]|nr:prolipoprotein diacylglyceryl transferase [Deltaproteobacteria bacterium]